MTTNIPNYDECVKFALKMKGIAGDSFKDTDLRVFIRDTANPGTVFTALRKGGIVIPVVQASLLGEYSVETTATVVIKANQITDMVDLFVPKSNDIQTFPIATFVEAWEATGGICTTAFPDESKTYRPKLIDLEYVELPDSFDELREAIAENAHDRWALERQSEGWTYVQSVMIRNWKHQIWFPMRSCQNPRSNTTAYWQKIRLSFS